MEGNADEIAPVGPVRSFMSVLPISLPMVRRLYVTLARDGQASRVSATRFPETVILEWMWG